MPTNDYIFKRLFGYKGNESITKDLLENILKTKIVGEISIESSKVLEKDLKDDKIGILDIHTTWHIKEDEYSEIILTELLEIHIISIARLEKMGKLKNNENDKLISWIKFIKNPNLLEEKDMANTKIKEAKKEYDKIVDDNREKYLAWLRMKYTWDMQDMEQTGISKGIKEGSKRKQIEIAKKMLDDKIEIETIIKYTRTY